MATQSRISVSRRQFLSSTAAGTVVSLATPALLLAGKSESQPVIVGEGDFKFEVQHDWPQLPDQYRWQTTHNVALDSNGCLYVIHEGRADQPDHPSIFVFDPDGRFVRAFGQEFQGGGHGIEVHQEHGQEYLYVCAYLGVKAFAKLDLHGEVVWLRRAPMQSGLYAPGEDTNPQNTWGRDRFLPTNVAFLPDGDILMADGYGSYYIHRYDRDGNWKACFGGPGDGKGKFNLPHGLWVDSRPGREPHIAVTDRVHHTLQYLTLDGEYVETHEGFGLPANCDTFEQFLVVPELLARVSILDANNQVVARLGDDSKRVSSDKQFTIRTDASRWQPGRFVHPHDACFDQHGNIFVAEWVGTGRVTRLKRLA